MATDFISRKDAKDKHCEICEHLNICYQYDDGGDDCRTYTGRTCIERQCFNAIPAADVRPVVRARWGLDPQCPVCGEDRYKGLEADIWAYWEPPFCPNCGADMRVKKENNND